jgi:nickel/cobalt exporter
VSAVAAGGPRPFTVGGGEGGGGAEGGIAGWLLAEQSRLAHLMSAKIHALHSDPGAASGLIALGLAYGVFHAAGPGHGKAVIASYMLANERSLKRAALLALLAALLQAMVAIVLVGAAGYLLSATASEMSRAAGWLELVSYSGVAAIGLWLVWRKGGALAAALGRHLDRSRALTSAPAYAGVAWSATALTPPSTAFRAASLGDGALRPDECGHAHAPDPALLNGALYWRSAVGTVIAAGIRPCSGAILVLVFALAQGLFAAGVAATFAMALGTAVTTGALASIAVFAKSTAMRFAVGGESRAALVARSFEFVAALAVLVFGVALMVGARGSA